MNGKEKEFYDILFKNCTEKEIYDILFKKKEIDDKTPKLRTQDDNKMLKSFYYKMSKYSKDKREPTFMGPLQVWPMVYIGMALRGALYSLSYLLFVVCM